MSKIESGNNITNGLVFYVDASKELNSINYNYNPTQTSSIWYDLSGNGGDINMSASTYTEANGGYFYFIPNNATVAASQGVGTANTISQSIGFQGNATIEIFLNVGTVNNSSEARAIIQCGSNGSTDGLNSFSIIAANTGTTYPKYRINIMSGSRVQSGVASTTGIFNSGSWECMTITFEGSTGGKIYRSGSLLTTHPLICSSSAGNVIYIGKISSSNIAGALYTFDTRIGSIKVWNRVLSDDEILQSYNTTKGRYGL